ncbi:MAG: major facilitator family transporter [Pseudonocardiales bacterium]|nr:major facilitator family transporter [Pseudonocardiales bacterium]
MTATARLDALPAAPREKLPLAGLLALFTAGFITILTETLPAGLLPEMSASLGVSESLTGQTVTVYAIGSAVTAIPLSVLTSTWPRRHLLLLALVGFVIANAVTAASASYAVVLVARLVAGVAAGLIWSQIGGYAARLVPGHLKGRAIAVAMAGTPVALSLGVPAGTFLGAAGGWRLTFAILTALTIALIGWVLLKVPNFPGQPLGDRMGLSQVLHLRGLRTILIVLAGFVVAHNILYTYIATIVSNLNMDSQTKWVLATFGVAALVSIWIVGIHIDRHHRKLIVTSMALFLAASLMLGLASTSPVLVYLAATLWGLSFGGATTLFLTAGSRVASGADIVQSFIVTIFNVGIAIAGIGGGALLAGFGAGSLAWAALILLVPTAVVTVRATKHAFPASTPSNV